MATLKPSPIITSDIEPFETQHTSKILTLAMTALRLGTAQVIVVAPSATSSPSPSPPPPPQSQLLSSSPSSSSLSLSLSSSSSSVLSIRSDISDNIEQTVRLLPEISLEEVSNHDSGHDCWIIIYDRVYDITNFMEMHPGGRDVLLEYAGLDASLAFRGVGHSMAALASLKQWEIGVLPVHQQIFRCKNGIQLSDLPE